MTFFVFTLLLNNSPVNDPSYEEDVWTHHPIVSIYKVGNDIFTKNTRAALFMLTLITISCIDSFLFASAGADASFGDAFLYPFVSLPACWLLSYGVGYFLRKYYSHKYDYEKSRQDEDDNEAQKNIFIFYFWIFLAWWIGFGLTVYNMNSLINVNSSAMGYWLASVFFGLIFELGIDVGVVFIAGNNQGFRDIIRRKGYMYDKLCHETYLLSLKRD